ncbi:MAG: hypothetical protein ACREA4_03400 [Nitrososphaera sp.]
MSVLLEADDEFSGFDALAFRPDGRALIAASGAWLYMWRDGNWSLYEKYTTGHNLSITEIAFTVDSRLLAVAGGEGLVYFWDVVSKQPMTEPLRGWPCSIGNLALSVRTEGT